MFATVGGAPTLLEKLFVNDRLAQSLANEDRCRRGTLAGAATLTEPLDHRGEVVLVGAGPRRRRTVDLKGFSKIQQADVVVYDCLGLHLLS